MSFFTQYFRKSFKRTFALLLAVVYTISTHAGSVEAARIHPSLPEAAAPFDINSFRLPPRIGSVERIYHSRGDQTVFLIQDAHSIPEAQKNIAKILQYLTRAYGVSTAGVEGASGALDATVFKTYPEKKRLKAFFSSLLAKGEIPGPVLALLTKDGARAQYFGVEDWPVYEEAVSLYLQALSAQPEALAEIEKETARLEERKKDLYPAELLKIDRAETDFRQDAARLLPLLKILLKHGMPDAKTHLYDLAASLNRAQSSKRLASLKSGRLFLELEDYIRKQKNPFLTSDSIRQLDQETHELGLLQKLAKLELTYEEWQEVKRQAPSSKAQEKALAFYRNSEKRDAIFYQNIQKRLRGEMAFVGGGFHVPALAERLVKAGVNVVVLQPKISELPEGNIYQQQMRGEVSWKKDLIRQGNKIRLYDSFLSYFKKSLAGSSAERAEVLRKVWQDEVIRHLAANGGIAKAGSYFNQIEDAESSAASMPAFLQKRFDEFSAGLKRLQSQNQLKQENILQLLQNVHVIAALSSPSLLAPRSKFQISAERSEARSAEKQASPAAFENFLRRMIQVDSKIEEADWELMENEFSTAQLASIGIAIANKMEGIDPNLVPSLNERKARISRMIVARNVAASAAARAKILDSWRTADGIEIIKGGKAGIGSSEDEILALTDDKGQVTGETAPKEIAHRDGLWHQTAHAHLVYKGKMLLQLRSLKKKGSAGKLQIGISGHINAGESQLQGISREGKEEIGIDLDPQKLVQISGINEIKRSYSILGVGRNNEFTTAFLYVLDDQELEQIRQNYNLNESDELWLVPFSVYEQILKSAQGYEILSTSLYKLIKDYPKIYERLRSEMRSADQIPADRLEAIRRAWPVGFPLENWKKDAGEGVLEPFLPKNEGEVIRLIELEKEAWVKRVGVELNDEDIRARILGRVRDGREDLPTPVLVLRVNGIIEGAIFMSFVETVSGLDGVPLNSQELISSHRPEGNTVVDYSVVSNPESPLKLFEPLAKATVDLAVELNKKRLLAYSRAEFFLTHAKILSGPEQAKAGVDPIFKDFARQFPEMRFENYQKFFGLSPEKVAQFKTDGSFERLLTQVNQDRQKRGIQALLSSADFEKYLRLDFENLETFGRFHLAEIGDAFLLRHHQKLGAKIVGILPGARPGDRRGAQASVIVEYALDSRSELQMDEKSEFESRLEDILKRLDTLKPDEIRENLAWLFRQYQRDDLLPKESKAFKTAYEMFTKSADELADKYKVKRSRVVSPAESLSLIERKGSAVEEMKFMLLYYAGVTNRILKDAVYISEFTKEPDLSAAMDYKELREMFIYYFRVVEKQNLYRPPLDFEYLGTDSRDVGKEEGPFYLAPFLVAREAGLEPARTFSQVAASLIDKKNPVQKVLLMKPSKKGLPPYLVVVFPGSPGKDQLRIQPMFLLKGKLPRFPEQDEAAETFLQKTFFMDESSLLPYVFAPDAPLRERFEKTKNLARLIQSGLALSRDIYQFSAREGTARAAAMIAKKNEREREAAEIGFYAVFAMEAGITKKFIEREHISSAGSKSVGFDKKLADWEQEIRRILQEEEKRETLKKEQAATLRGLGLAEDFIPSGQDLEAAQKLKEGKFLDAIAAAPLLKPLVLLLFERDETGKPIFGKENISNYMTHLRSLLTEFLKAKELQKEIQHHRESLPNALRITFDFEVARALLDGMKTKAHDAPGVDALRRGLLQAAQKSHPGKIFSTLTGHYLQQIRQQLLERESAELEKTLWEQFTRDVKEKTLSEAEKTVDALLQKRKLLAAIPSASKSAGRLQAIVLKSGGKNTTESASSAVLSEIAGILKDQSELKEVPGGGYEKAETSYRALLEFRRYLEENQTETFLLNKQRLNDGLLAYGLTLSSAYHDFISGIQQAYLQFVLTEAEGLANHQQFEKAQSLLVRAEKAAGPQKSFLEIRKKIVRISIDKIIRDANDLAKETKYGEALALLDKALENHSGNADLLAAHKRIGTQGTSSQSALPGYLRTKAGEILNRHKPAERMVKEMLEAVRDGNSAKIENKLGKFLDHWVTNVQRITQGATHPIHPFYEFALEVNDVLEVRNIKRSELRSSQDGRELFAETRQTVFFYPFEFEGKRYSIGLDGRIYDDELEALNDEREARLWKEPVVARAYNAFSRSIADAQEVLINGEPPAALPDDFSYRSLDWSRPDEDSFAGQLIQAKQDFENAFPIPDASRVIHSVELVPNPALKRARIRIVPNRYTALDPNRAPLVEEAAGAEVFRLFGLYLEGLLMGWDWVEDLVKTENQDLIIRVGSQQITFPEAFEEIKAARKNMENGAAGFFLQKNGEKLKEYVNDDLFAEFKLMLSDYLMEGGQRPALLLAEYLNAIYALSWAVEGEGALKTLKYLRQTRPYFDILSGRYRRFNKQKSEFEKELFPLSRFIPQKEKFKLADSKDLTDFQALAERNKDQDAVVFYHKALNVPETYRKNQGAVNPSRYAVVFAYRGIVYLVYRSISHSQLAHPDQAGQWKRVEAARFLREGVPLRFIKLLNEAAADLHPVFARRIDDLITGGKIRLQAAEEKELDDWMVSLGLAVNSEGEFLNPQYQPTGYEVDKSRYAYPKWLMETQKVGRKESAISEIIPEQVIAEGSVKVGSVLLEIFQYQDGSFKVETPDKNSYSLDEKLKIGRQSDQHIILNHSSVSRVHAALRKSGDKIEVRDYGSTNGTYINENRIAWQQKWVEVKLIPVQRSEMRAADEADLSTYDLVRQKKEKGIKTVKEDLEKLLQERRAIHKKPMLWLAPLLGPLAAFIVFFNLSSGFWLGLVISAGIGMAVSVIAVGSAYGSILDRIEAKIRERRRVLSERDPKAFKQERGKGKSEEYEKPEMNLESSLGEGGRVYRAEAAHDSLSLRDLKDLGIHSDDWRDAEFTLESRFRRTATMLGKTRWRWLLSHPSLDVREIQERQKLVAYFISQHEKLSQLRSLLEETDGNGYLISGHFLARVKSRRLKDLVWLLTSPAPGFLGYSIFKSVFLGSLDFFGGLSAAMMTVYVFVHLHAVIRILFGKAPELHQVQSLLTETGKTWKLLSGLPEAEKPVHLKEIEKVLSAVFDDSHPDSLAVFTKPMTVTQFQKFFLQEGTEKRFEKILGALAELDAYQSIAQMNIDHEMRTMPEVFEADHPSVALEDMTHPIFSLTPDFVPNSITLDSAQNRLYLIAAPNGTGKSTMIKTTLLNIVLAQMGSMIPAKSARLTPVKIRTHINLEDSLAEGKSRFIVEVGLMKDHLDALIKEGKVFLIFGGDEIFEGTNPGDARLIRVAAIRYLLKKGVVGFIATHDLELMKIFKNVPGIGMLHFREEADGRADFKLREGPAESTNALEVVRRAGFPDDFIEELEQAVQEFSFQRSEVRQPELPPMERIEQVVPQPVSVDPAWSYVIAAGIGISILIAYLVLRWPGEKSGEPSKSKFAKPGAGPKLFDAKALKQMASIFWNAVNPLGYIKAVWIWMTTRPPEKPVKKEKKKTEAKEPESEIEIKEETKMPREALPSEGEISGLAKNLAQTMRNHLRAKSSEAVRESRLELLEKKLAEFDAISFETEFQNLKVPVASPEELLARIEPQLRQAFEKEKPKSREKIEAKIRGIKIQRAVEDFKKSLPLEADTIESWNRAAEEKLQAARDAHQLASDEEKLFHPLIDNARIPVAREIERKKRIEIFKTEFLAFRDETWKEFRVEKEKIALDLSSVREQALNELESAQSDALAVRRETYGKVKEKFSESQRQAQQELASAFQRAQVALKNRQQGANDKTGEPLTSFFESLDAELQTAFSDEVRFLKAEEAKFTEGLEPFYIKITVDVLLYNLQVEELEPRIEAIIQETDAKLAGNPEELLDLDKIAGDFQAEVDKKIENLKTELKTKYQIENPEEGPIEDLRARANRQIQERLKKVAGGLQTVPAEVEKSVKSFIEKRRRIEETAQSLAKEFKLLMSEKIALLQMAASETTKNFKNQFRLDKIDKVLEQQFEADEAFKESRSQTEKEISQLLADQFTKLAAQVRAETQAFDGETTLVMDALRAQSAAAAARFTKKLREQTLHFDSVHAEAKKTLQGPLDLEIKAEIEKVAREYQNKINEVKVLKGDTAIRTRISQQASRTIQPFARNMESLPEDHLLKTSRPAELKKLEEVTFFQYAIEVYKPLMVQAEVKKWESEFQRQYDRLQTRWEKLHIGPMRQQVKSKIELLVKNAEVSFVDQPGYILQHPDLPLLRDFIQQSFLEAERKQQFKELDRRLLDSAVTRWFRVYADMAKEMREDPVYAPFKSLLAPIARAPHSQGADFESKYGKLLNRLLSSDLEEPLLAARAHLHLAAAYLQQGKWSPAAKSIQEALKVDPANPDAILLTAELHKRKNEVNEALTALNKLLDIRLPVSFRKDVFDLQIELKEMAGKSEVRASFADRPPSTHWATLKYQGVDFMQVWFKPEKMPYAIIFRIPDKTFLNDKISPVLSVANLMSAIRGTGIAAADIRAWSYLGETVSGDDLNAAQFEKKIPPIHDLDYLDVFVFLNSPDAPESVEKIGLQQIPADRWELFLKEWHFLLGQETDLKGLHTSLSGLAAQLSNEANKSLSAAAGHDAPKSLESKWNQVKGKIRPEATAVKNFAGTDHGPKSSPARKMLTTIYQNNIMSKMPFTSAAEMGNALKLLDDMKNERKAALQSGQALVGKSQQLLNEAKATINKIRDLAKSMKRKSEMRTSVRLAEILFRGSRSLSVDELRSAARNTERVLSRPAMSTEMFLSQIEQALIQISSKDAELFISQEVYEQKVGELIAFLKAYFQDHPDSKFRLALDLPEMESVLAYEDQTGLYAKAVGSFGQFIQDFVVRGKVAGNSGRKLLAALKKLQIRFSNVRHWKAIPSQDGKVIPVVSSAAEGDLPEEAPLVWIGMAGQSRDPRIRAYAALLQFALAIVTADGLQNHSMLRKDVRLIQGELLKAKTLLRAFDPSSQSIVIENGRAVVALEGIEAALRQSMLAAQQTQASA